MSTLVRLSLAALLPVLLSACTQARQAEIEAPAYFNQVTDAGYHYTHNWAGVPCYGIDLKGPEWAFEESFAERARWSRGDTALSVYFSDNREQRFAVSGMDDEAALRAFLAYELEYIRPNFDFQVTKQPKFASVDDSVWMQWGWTGKNGKRQGTRDGSPSDQRHIIISLWLDPWVLSFDWASPDIAALEHTTLEMIEMLESLEFYPDCFTAMEPGETR